MKLLDTATACGQTPSKKKHQHKGRINSLLHRNGFYDIKNIQSPSTFICGSELEHVQKRAEPNLLIKNNKRRTLFQCKLSHCSIIALIETMNVRSSKSILRDNRYDRKAAGFQQLYYQSNW